MRGIVPPPLKTCAECDFKSHTLKNNLAHWSAEHPEKFVFYKCDWKNCGFSSKKVVEIKKHRRKHLIDEKHLIKCNDCEKYYRPKYQETRHSLVHSSQNKFKCTICERAFNSSDNLKVHDRSHETEDQKISHSCTLCERKFTQKANLEAHMRTHTGLRYCSRI